MATASPLFGTATTVTINLASLASSTADVGVQSDAIDCATLDCVDMWIGGKVTLGTTPGANTRVEIGADAVLRRHDLCGRRVWGDSGCHHLSIHYVSFRGEVAGSVGGAALLRGRDDGPDIFTWGVLVGELFGGALPPKFVVFVTQNTTAALNSTAGTHELKYRVINYESPNGVSLIRPIILLRSISPASNLVSFRQFTVSGFGLPRLRRGLAISWIGTTLGRATRSISTAAWLRCGPAPPTPPLLRLALGLAFCASAICHQQQQEAVRPHRTWRGFPRHKHRELDQCFCGVASDWGERRPDASEHVQRRDCGGLEFKDRRWVRDCRP